MSDNEIHYLVFACFQLNKETEQCYSLIIAESQEEIQKWKVKKQKSKDGADTTKRKKTKDSGCIDPDAKPKNAPNSATELTELMDGFRDSISGIQPLISASSFIIPIVRESYIHHEMYLNAGRDLTFLDEDGEFKTYGVTIEQNQKLRGQVSRLREFDEAMVALPGAILLSLVATFDSYISDTIRIMLRSKPERFSGSDKTITIKDVLSMKSFDDVVNKVIDDQIASLMRGNHVDQIKFIESNFNIKIRDDYDEWSKFIEIFERRNLVAHGNCIVNNQYIEICSSNRFDISGLEKGTKLSLDSKYLRRSADTLMEFGVVLIFVLWRKNFPELTDKAYTHLNDLTYHLIKDGKPRVAARILEFALYKQTPKIQDHLLKMMTVNLANAQKKIKNEKRAQEIIKAVDWSATADEFKICIAALEGNIDDFVSLMPKVAKTDAISKSAFREWPIFDWIRNDEKIREKFQEIHGEPLIQATEQEPAETADPDTPAEQETVH